MEYNVIAIEREYASGGSEIGQKLAARLDVPCYGLEILEKAAAQMGVPVAEVQRQEETITGDLRFGLHSITRPWVGATEGLTQAQRLCLTEVGVIRNLAHSGPCIIVGRAAAVALREENSVLKVFVRAGMATRIRRAVEVYGHAEEKAEAILRRVDKRRSYYYGMVTGETWGKPESFHIVIDSGYLGIDSVVDILEAAAKKRS